MYILEKNLESSRRNLSVP